MIGEKIEECGGELGGAAAWGEEDRVVVGYGEELSEIS